MTARRIMALAALVQHWDDEEQAAVLLDFIDRLGESVPDVLPRLRAYLDTALAQEAAEATRPFSHAGCWID